MTRMFKCGLAIFALCVAAATTQAGTVGFSVNVIQAYDADFNEIPTPDLSTNIGSEIILHLGLNVTATPGAGERDFLNMALDLTLNNLADLNGYTAVASPVVDINPGPITNKPVGYL